MKPVVPLHVILALGALALPHEPARAEASPACDMPDPARESADRAAADRWVRASLETMDPRMIPVTFLINGKSSRTTLGTASWQRLEPSLVDHPAERRSTRTLVWTNPDAGLELRVEVRTYTDFPVAEWTGSLRATGAKSSPPVRDLLAADLLFPGEEFTLHGIQGDDCSAQSYAPYAWTPGTGEHREFRGQNGKPTGGRDGWPYFNLAGRDGGRILALGWPGQWLARFQREPGGMRWLAGQEATAFQLMRGETARTPSATILFWKGTDWIAAQNLWRRWYRAHVMPRTLGKPQRAVTQIQVGARERDIATVQAFLREGITPDLCWRDAGDGWWSIPEPRPFKDRLVFLNGTGFWEPDPAKFPRGFLPFGEWIRARGMQLVVWFEPEKTTYTDPTPGAYSSPVLATRHPEWLLPGVPGFHLLNLGDPDAHRWLTDHLSAVLRKQGIDWFRVDLNQSGPARAWRQHDAVVAARSGHERVGLTENFHVQGLLALWDALRARLPHLRIDSCASGGRRNDLETMRRAVPLLRSDFQFSHMPGVIEGNQGHTYGLSFWLPFQGTGVYSYDTYDFRSFLLASFGMGTLTPGNTSAQRQAHREARFVGPFFLEGDYHPLTPYSLARDRWIAWQFHRPDLDQSVVQAFRRPDAADATLRIHPRALDPARQYRIRNLDGGEEIRSGAELARGYTITLTQKPAAALLHLEPAD